MNIRELKPLTNLLNNPRRYLDEHFKLIFMYPILYTSGSGINLNLVRDFVANYYLKELYVSNSLHLISQVRSVETQQTLPQQMALSTAPQSQTQDFQYFNSKYEYQEAVNKVTEALKKFLEIDPVYSKFRPAVSTIIVPENLLTIPVITGTRAFPMDLFLMTIFLIVSGLENIPLTNYNNVTKIIQSLKSKYVNSPQFGDVLVDFSNKMNVPVKLKKLSKKFNVAIFKKPRTSKQKQEHPVIDEEKVLKYIFTSIDQFEVHWKFVLDNKTFKSKFGFDICPRDQFGTRVIKTFGSTVGRIVERIMFCYNNKTQSELNDCEITIFNFFQPVNSPKNLIEINSKMNNNILSDLYDTVNDSLKERLNECLDSLSNDTSSLVVIGEKLLEYYKKDIKEFENTLSNVFSNKITSNTPQDYDFAVENLIPHFDMLGSLIEKGISKYEQIISSNLCSDLADYFHKTVKNIFKRNVDLTLNKIYDRDEAGYVTYLRTQKNVTDLSTSELHKLLSPLLYNILYYSYLLCFIEIFANFLYKSETEFEVLSSEITDFPNYTLVLPLEVLDILYTFLYTRDIKRAIFLKESLIDRQTISTRYIKDVVKSLTNRLRVPNIIVYDERKRTVYYKFMNQTEITNVNINTIEHFVKSLKSQNIYY